MSAVSNWFGRMWGSRSRRHPEAGMSSVFPVPAIDAFSGIDPESVEIVFHGINKSGSYAMATAMRDAYIAAGRRREFNAHYFLGGDYKAYTDRVEAWRGPGFHVAHRLYGALLPRPNRVWVTQFRHPLPRVLSCYNWLKIKHIKRSPDLPFPPLDEWVVKTKGKSHSMVTQFGIGFGAHAKPLRGRLKPRDFYELSLGALEREVTCIGLAEYFEESILLFAAVAGLPHVVPWVRDKRNPGRPLSSEISDENRALIEDVFHYDFELYRYALARFRAQIQSVNFGNVLKEFKVRCAGEYNDRILSV